MYNSQRKEIVFLGRSLEIIRAFPIIAKREAGFQLDRIQNGSDPTDWKPLKTVGAGAREIRISTREGGFRVVYVAKFEEAVFVLHAFSKKAQKTNKLDIEVGRAAYRRMMEVRGK